jgi:hypothetical protein
MKERLRAGANAAQGRLRAAITSAREHRFWVEVGAITIFGVFAAFSYGYAALSRASVLQAQAANLGRVDEAFSRWQTQLERPSSAETRLWRESDESVRNLRSGAVRPLQIAQVIARRADQVGIDDVRIQLLSSDSIPDVESIERGTLSVEPLEEGLHVQFEGSMADVVSFLGVLPPHATVASIQSSGSDGRLNVDMVLVMREVVPAD